MSIRSWQYKKFHISYGIAWLCIGIICGLALSCIITNDSLGLLILAIAIILSSFMRIRWYGIMMIFCMAVVIGIIRGSSFTTELTPLAIKADSSVTIQGVIVEDPRVTARGDTMIGIANITIDTKKYTGTVWATLRGEQAFRRGDTIRLSGKTKSGFGIYQLSMTYPIVVATVKSDDPLINLRDAFVEAVRKSVVEPAASLGVGFVVGQKTALPHTLDEQLRIVGLTHLVVASGYNLTILVRAAKRLFEKRSKFLVAFTTIMMTVSFIAISGVSPSMVRAGLVAGLSIAAWYYGRRFHPIMLIAYVAAFTAMLNPLYLWADVGWWLSFLAFIGVLIVAPLLLRMIYRDRKKQPGGIVQIAMETLAAQIMTLPVILIVFGKLPVLAIIANMMAAPLIPLAMLFTAIAGIMTMIIPMFSVVVGLPAEILLSYFIAVVRMLAAPDWAQVDITLGPNMVVALYGLIVMSCVTLWRITRYNFRSQSVIE